MFKKKLLRWVGILYLPIFVLRIGYRYYQSQQRPHYAEQMEALEAKNQALIKAIKADQEAQRAAGKVPVTADSTAFNADSTLQAN